MNKSIIIARGGEQPSRIESYFQKMGAKTMSFPILKSMELDLSAEEFAVIAKKNRLIFLNPTSIDIFFRQYSMKAISTSLPEKIEYISEKSRKILEEKGVKSNLAAYGQQPPVLLGHNHQRVNPYSENDLLLHTHQIDLDFSCEMEMRRLLDEEEWHTVIFSNMLSVDFFIKYWKLLASSDYMKLGYAAIGNKVQAYASEQGFKKIDMEIQQALSAGKWKA